MIILIIVNILLIFLYFKESYTKFNIKEKCKEVQNDIIIDESIGCVKSILENLEHDAYDLAIDEVESLLMKLRGWERKNANRI